MSRCVVIALCFVLFGAVASSAAEAPPSGPRSGDVFREYAWRPKGKAKWERVTGPDVETDQAREFLPNKVHAVAIDDLDGAVRAEAVVEMLLCHTGTKAPAMRVNGNAWLPIPDATSIPGDRGRGGPSRAYQFMRYPTIAIPLEQLSEGENTFEFTCRAGEGLGGWWPQWIHYGVVFRIYYDDAKPHPTGRIARPANGAMLGDDPEFEVAVGGVRPVERVDLIGLYDDFNWEGDGISRQWHGHYHYGQLARHMGTSTSEPHRIRWDTSWIPTQEQPVSVVARITDDRGMSFVTDAVDDLHLKRKTTVMMHEPRDVPRNWATRAGETDRCKIDVPESLEGLADARLVLSTWQGHAAEVIGVNDVKVAGPIGKNHDLSCNAIEVSVDLLRRGENTVHAFSDTEHHGIEVQWPGPVLFLRFDRPE